MKSNVFILSFQLCMIVGHSTIYAQKPNEDKRFSFVVFGDMPYFLPNDYLKFENLIKASNQLKPAFNIHVGDFKSSSTDCSDSIFSKALYYFKLFERPLFILRVIMNGQIAIRKSQINMTSKNDWRPFVKCFLMGLRV